MMWLKRLSERLTAIGLTGSLVTLLFLCVAFLLGCHELQAGDGDIWWHLRGGEWILQNGKVPDLDPFTFGSQDQPWVDIHWLGQVVFFLAYRMGAVSGVILLTATIACASILIALRAAPADSPLAVIILVWLPSLLLASSRFYDRPEIFTLLFFTIYLAVIVRLDNRPQLAWILPVIQLFWVNVQGLFVFGPLLLGLRLAAQAGKLAWGTWHRQLVRTPVEKRWWGHVGGAGTAVALACLATPYGLSGTLFPVLLYPKATQAGNEFKSIIDELASVKQVVSSISIERAGNVGFVCCLHFLLLLLPVSFLLPAIWRATKARRAPGCDAGSQSLTLPFLSPQKWLWILGVAVLLLACNTLTLSTRYRPAWFVELGQAAPLISGAAGIVGGFLLIRFSRLAALLASTGAVGLALWIIWLNEHLTAGTSTTPQFLSSSSVGLATLALLGALVAALILYVDGSFFLMALAGLFGYFALSSMLNLGRFGLVAGFVLSCNLGSWVGRLLVLSPRKRQLNWASSCLKGALACLLLAWATALLTRHVPTPLSILGDVGLKERPLTFAHDAVRFAGRPGMPARSLVFDLIHASLYTFHNAPRCKTFMDARLEMPSTRTFRTYVSVEKMLWESDARWADAVRELGDPAILVSHHGYSAAEATILIHPDWRLVYFDALMAVFIPRTDKSLEARFPTIDFAARHFQDSKAPSQPDAPSAAWKEGHALSTLAAELHHYPSTRWKFCIPALLRALDRADLAAEQDPRAARVWTLLADCHWNFVLALSGASAPSLDTWDPKSSLGWAQTTYCLRRAHECAPDDARTLDALYRAFAARHMSDAQMDMGQRLLALGLLSPAQAAELEKLSRGLDQAAFPGNTSGRESSARLKDLLQTGRFAEAAGLAQQALDDGKRVADWQLADRLASACMHLGLPQLARQIWAQADSPPSSALRASRLGDTYWVEQDYELAIPFYQEACRLDPSLVDAHWALAWLNADLGNAPAANEACRAALALNLPEATRSQLTSLERLLTAHVETRRHDAK